LKVLIDSPLLLDMLGVNKEYEVYGKELLDAIKASGASPAVLDHCITEAENTVGALVAYARSGFSHKYGERSDAHWLNSLVNNIGKRAEERLGITSLQDPDNNTLLRLSKSAFGDIETGMNTRMRAWTKEDAKTHDRNSVFAMISLRDTRERQTRICDSSYMFISKNTALVNISNDSWRTWLTTARKFSRQDAERFPPVGMSDKQFAGYLWMRAGGEINSISQARLLSHCYAAIRPREDVKRRVYNAILDLEGQGRADDIAALFEDKEAAKALMRATKGNPEDVTSESLPGILEKMQLAAGEFAASAARADAKKLRDADAYEHAEQLAKKSSQADELIIKLQKAESDRQTAEALVVEQKAAIERRRKQALSNAFRTGVTTYRIGKWCCVATFAALSAVAIWLPEWKLEWLQLWVGSSLEGFQKPLAAAITLALGTFGFWFVPNTLLDPLRKNANKSMAKALARIDPELAIPSEPANFEKNSWPGVL
jgi:hypothetical protein